MFSMRIGKRPRGGKDVLLGTRSLSSMFYFLKVLRGRRGTFSKVPLAYSLYLSYPLKLLNAVEQPGSTESVLAAHGSTETGVLFTQLTDEGREV